MFFCVRYQSPVCELEVVGAERDLVAIWMQGQKHYKSGFFGEIVEISREGAPEILKKTLSWLDRYFLGEKVEISEFLEKDGRLPFSPQGGEFRQEVWKILCSIPYGETISYGEIAKEVAKRWKMEKMSAQAVGGAVGHNPIAIVVPCHRVLSADGRLTGYAGGILVKKKLLEIEGILYKD